MISADWMGVMAWRIPKFHITASKYEYAFFVVKICALSPFGRSDLLGLFNADGYFLDGYSALQAAYTLNNENISVDAVEVLGELNWFGFLGRTGVLCFCDCTDRILGSRRIIAGSRM